MADTKNPAADTQAAETAALKELVLQQQTALEEMRAEMKAISAAKAAAKPKPKKEITLPEEPFLYGGKKYKFLIPAFQIPTGGTLQKVVASEAMENEDIHKFLIENKRWGIIKAV